MTSFRQICDKACNIEILLSEWSPMRDLIAVVLSNGDVRLHRLYWQKVWVMPGKTNKAVQVAWKPDGKLLAIGYEDGSVSLVEIEKAVILNTVKCPCKVTSLCWSSQIKSKKYNELSEKCVPFVEKDNLQLEFNNLNSLINSSDNEYEFMLTVGCDNGEVSYYAEGIFPILSVNLSNNLFQNVIVLNTHVELSTGMLSVIFKGVESNGNVECTYLQQYSSKLFSEQSSDLFFLSRKLIKIITLIDKCEKVINRMKEVSDDVCFRINTKLEKLEEMLQATGSSVVCVFTAAYTIGEASPEMETFLIQHLTIKGLKQISQSVHSSYLNLQAFINEELEIILQHLLFNIVELCGMEEMFDKFGLLRITDGITQKCLSILHQLMLKTRVLLQTVCSDMNNFRIFFVWLISFMFTISDEENPIPFKQFTNEEFDVMLEFLEYRLLKAKKNNKYGYDLERVSQFFQTESLDFPDDFSSNAWYNFISSNNLLKSSKLVIKPNSQATLVSLFNQLKDALNVIFQSFKQYLSDSFNLKTSIKIFENHPDHPDYKKSCFPSTSFLQKENLILVLIVACSCESNNLILLKIDANSLVNVHHCVIELDPDLNSSYTDDNYIVLRNAQFYNFETITVVFEEFNSNDNSSSVIGQVALSKILNNKSIELTADYNYCVLNTILELKQQQAIRGFISELRYIEGFSSKFICVNGYSRKVCCLVAASGRRVCIFDMSSEDDIENDKNNDTSESQL
ncbi:anaphase-promoting complex subunit 4 [Hydra vulgaris]|uniref:Anaphase-promoting complex subunit 4 n=1 Tax=Hydra vulgaris TaxID=6087 RepID=A0ABM4C1M6_HYDVU